MNETLEALNEACVEAGVCLPEPTDHEILLHFGQVELGTPGTVVDKARANGSACSCIKYQGKDICYTRGVIGSLTRDQEKTLCDSKNYNNRPELLERFGKFAEAAEVAHKKVDQTPKGERLQPWLSAMSEELAKRGIEV